MGSDVYCNGKWYRRVYYPEYEKEPQRRCRLCDLYKHCVDAHVNCSATNVFMDIEYFGLIEK